MLEREVASTQVAASRFFYIPDSLKQETLMQVIDATTLLDTPSIVREVFAMQMLFATLGIEDKNIHLCIGKDASPERLHPVDVVATQGDLVFVMGIGEHGMNSDEDFVKAWRTYLDKVKVAAPEAKAAALINTEAMTLAVKIYRDMKAEGFRLKSF